MKDESSIKYKPYGYGGERRWQIDNREDWLRHRPHKRADDCLIEERTEPIAADIKRAESDNDEAIKRKFVELCARWKRETLHQSNVKKIISHPAYQRIIGMADVAPKSVLRLILEDLKTDPADWFWALSTITNENPIKESDAGDVGKMALAWVQWGREKRILND